MIRRIAQAALLGLTAALSLGCELIAEVDRSRIPEPVGAQSGSGGDGSTGTSTGTGTGGQGGSGAAGGSGGAGGAASGGGGAGGAGGGAGGAGGGAGGAGGGSGGTGGGSGGAGGAGGASGPLCGDGALDPGEACDDGDQQSLDGCSSNCLVDGFDEVEINDTLGQANGPFSSGVIVWGSIKPGSDVDYFSFLVPEVADLHLETYGASGAGSCPSIDTVLTLLGPDGTTLGTDDDGGINACSRIDRTVSAAAGHVPPGTYYARVEAYAGYEPIPAYGLAITFDALCNDGLKQGLEECDGAPTCSLGCDRIPLCGDGFIDAPELCDDGNGASGDGCSSSCQYELLGEGEPNGGPASASGPFSPNVLLGGAIAPAGDVDTFALTLPVTGDLALRTFDGSFEGNGPGSCAGVDTRLTLLAPDGSTVLIDHDQGGLGACAAIDPALPAGKKARHLAPGTYFVQVRDALGDKVIPAYTLLATYAARCGDEVTSGGEECDGGPGCGPSCDRIPLCGDGFIDAPETCDDQNLSSGDGCSSSCAVELSPEIEPNQSALGATGPFVPHALIQGAIMPGDDLDYFAVVLDATSDLSLETFDGDGPGSCVGIDTVLTLHGTNGLSTLAYKDSGGLALCSRVDPALDPGARHLPAGTYFVEVQDAQNNTVIPAYRLEIRLTARCGDGKVEGFEECDGGPGCSATCDRIPVCGDGLLDLPESCDDGNATAGDGCSASCQMELVAEVEPNDDPASADARALGAPPVKLAGSGFVSGAITPVGDVDLYRLELAAPSTLRLETFDQSASGCVIATTLRLRDAAGVELYSDDNSGIGACSALVLHLPAGVYYPSVEERDNDALLGGYRLAVEVVSEGGSEIEPNETAATGTAVSGGDVVVTGEHVVNDDTDFYALSLPAGASLRAEIIEGGNESCEGFDLDSSLTLYDANGAELGSDDDGGRGYCSSFDGVGAIPAHPFAHLLPAGAYFLAVEASPAAQAPGDSSGQFSYRLVISMR